PAAPTHAHTLPLHDALPISQPFHVAEQFTGTPGRYVKLADTVKSFREIVDGKHDELPEQAFYMVGDIGEAMDKAKKLREVAAGRDRKSTRLNSSHEWISYAV